MRGRPIRLSLARRIVLDILHFGVAFPTVPVQRRMTLKQVVSARAACADRPRWTVIFAKAYALTAREFPELRRAYIKFPWPRLYEYPESNANIVIERDYEGEASLFSLLIKEPAARSLREVADIVQHAYSVPVNEVSEFRRSLRIAAFPWPLRRLLWWIGLNIGRQRPNYFGTFAISVYSALNAESLHPIAPVTTVLNYGVIDSAGDANVRIIYDHRVMNGAAVARVLARLEEILNTAIVDELRQLAQTAPQTQKTRAI